LTKPFLIAGEQIPQAKNHRSSSMAMEQLQPVIWYWADWLRRRKLAKLNEAEKIMNEVDGKSVP
jgi:hypothetical protein